LHRLTAPQRVANRERLVLRFDPDDAAHEEIAALERALRRVDREPDERLALEQLAVGFGKLRRRRLNNGRPEVLAAKAPLAA
jgi:hypothetical protein